jgi:hypothetical protein
MEPLRQFDINCIRGPVGERYALKGLLTNYVKLSTTRVATSCAATR